MSPTGTLLLCTITMVQEVQLDELGDSTMKTSVRNAVVFCAVCTSLATDVQGGSQTLAEDLAGISAPLFGSVHQILYVDNEGADPTVQDSDELGTSEHPFGHIQDALDVAEDGARVIVRPGQYTGPINFLGKSISLMGYDPYEANGCTTADYPVIQGRDNEAAVQFVMDEDPNTLLTGFVIVGGRTMSVGAIDCRNSSPVVSHCLVVGTQGTESGSTAIRCVQSQALFTNCTIADNLSYGITMTNSQVQLANSILWDNRNSDLYIHDGDNPQLDYCNIEDNWLGEGVAIVSRNPLFATANHWVTQDVRTRYRLGDYHLQSEVGCWNPETKTWIQNATDSPCIDAGNPGLQIDNEPVPHGRRVNLGAYGGTCVASKSSLAPEFVHIPDPILKAAIEDALWVADPTPEDMLELTSFTCTHSNGSGVQDLTGLEYAKNLRTLILSDNSIADLGPLANLKKLDKLVFNHNYVSDLSPLSTITTLQHLDMHGNKFRNNLHSLHSLKWLDTLIIRENAINDLGDLWYLPQLSHLDISENDIYDLSVIVRIFDLRELILKDNPYLQNISPLSSMDSLRKLELDDCAITSVSNLTGLTNLETLDLEGNELDQDSYCSALPAIARNNPGIDLEYPANESAPNSVSASQGSYAGGVEVSWNAVCNGPNYTTYYSVSRANSLGESPTDVSGWKTDLGFVDTSTVPGVHYIYWVQSATSSHGLNESDYSDSCTGWE